MGDVAKGIKSFKKGMGDEEAAPETKTVESKAEEAKDRG
jgi:sec-independent protein translocase protein TatA